MRRPSIVLPAVALLLAACKPQATPPTTKGLVLPDSADQVMYGVWFLLNDAGVRLVGAEAAGEGIASGLHAASLAAGRPGVLHGNRTYVLCDDDGQIIETHSVSAGLDYPGVGPEHAFLKDRGRADYVGVTDDEALQAFHLLARMRTPSARL